MALSYAQNLEDYHLAVAFADQQRGFYIDVGAGHPVADNVSFWFYERGWSGIVIEPQSDLAKLYAYIRPRDICEPCVIGSTKGEVDFFEVAKFHGLSTTVPANAEGAAGLGTGYRVVRAPMTTMAELCERHGVTEIDFLKVDVEGAEGNVLRGNDWRRFRPKVIVVEAVILDKANGTWNDWEPLLLEQGYEFTLFDTLNRFYVAREHPDILSRMPRERAPWNSATHMYEIGRAPDNPAHPDHRLATELTRAFCAALPMLDRDVLASFVARIRNVGSATEVAAIRDELDTDEFRAALGRIACGYDGGQILD